MSTRSIPSIDALLGSFSVFLLDQFGVLHDGVQPYAGTTDALQQIIDSGARVIIISNSGKRSVVNRQRLSRMGIGSTLYHSLVTSGEVAFAELQQQLASGALKPEAKCFLFANDGDLSAVDGLDLLITSQIDSADIILMSGIRGETADLDHYANLLQRPLERDIPMICTNPDKWAMFPGGPVMGAGKVAEHYQSAGGRVHWIGKPYPAIYQWILAREAITGKKGVVCIGDSVEHDIAGGQSAGLATVLVRTGIHSTANSAELQALYQQHAATPDYLLPALGGAST